ncbi:hypothetical protein MNKW57_23100 [Biformimicrobium ophioploci]|uniref:Uncharacterized protein n=1 Tax=Biformimicrobium ophioploci TaxID=3036711 RepID=A0ABQ6M0X8_9GAMM|nr:hypothetical protein MNKW57_23100 [Microbulbifer sp. NKW57]
MLSSPLDRRGQNQSSDPKNNPTRWTQNQSSDPISLNTGVRAPALTPQVRINGVRAIALTPLIYLRGL